jgi:Protein of unknown function (DUF4058)
MPSPFPGMNPYLECSDLWTELHHRLITALANAITANLSFEYRVAIEKRVYTVVPEDSVLIGIPDASVVSQSTVSQSTVRSPGGTLSTMTANSDQSTTVMLPIPEEVRESYLEIRDGATRAVITAIEVLSPANKRPGKGRQTYETKRDRVLESATHFVEIDLLREHLPMPILGAAPITDYRILVSRASQRPKAQLYAFDLQQPIPVFALPLKPSDADLAVDLQGLLFEIYNQARFDLAIAYTEEPVPPLKAPAQAWADELLKAKGLR